MDRLGTTASLVCVTGAGQAARVSTPTKHIEERRGEGNRYPICAAKTRISGGKRGNNGCRCRDNKGWNDFSSGEMPWPRRPRRPHSRDGGRHPAGAITMFRFAERTSRRASALCAVNRPPENLTYEVGLPVC
jgi:hypothetical protein